VFETRLVTSQVM